ncbi:peptidyl-prolyl cis-trans isomerase, partial [bacterium]|nr:peptidyl-prolyl cis-trans isomerase [bacterium]
MKKRLGVLTICFVFANLLLWGCKKDSVEDPLLIRVGSESIGKQEFLAQGGLQDTSGNTEISPLILRKAAEQWAMNQILIQEAAKRRLDQDRFFQAELAEIRDKMLIKSLYAELEKSITVGDEEVREEYDLHRQEYVTPADQIDLVYVLCPSRESARHVRTELQNGTALPAILNADFQLVGEDIGWVTKQDINTEIADIAFALVPGGISAPILFDQGQHIVMQCRQRRQAGTVLPLEEIEDIIKRRLFIQKKLRAERDLHDSLWIAYNPE